MKINWDGSLPRMVAETAEELTALQALADQNAMKIDADTGEMTFGKTAGIFMIQRNSDGFTDLIAMDDAAHLALTEILRGHGLAHMRSVIPEEGDNRYHACLSVSVTPVAESDETSQLNVVVQMKANGEVDRDAVTRRPRIFDAESARYMVITDPAVTPIPAKLVLGQ